jgi:hypothetical protein
LGCLLGFYGRPGDQQRGSKGDSLMHAHELLVGVLVAALCERDEF